MADDLERHILSIEGEGPSPDFVAKLRKQLTAEMTEPEGDAGDEPVIAVQLRPDEKENSMTRTRKIWLGSAAAIALIAGVLVLSRDSDEEKIETITTLETTAPEQSSTTVASIPEETTTFGAGLVPLNDPNATIQPGIHFVDNVSLPFTFTSTRRLDVYETIRRIVLADPASRGPGELAIVFNTLTVDFDRWLEILDDGLSDLPREDLAIDGLDATRIEINASLCGEDSPFCGDSGTKEAGLFNVQFARAGLTHQVWVIEQKGEPPLTAVVSITAETQSFWFDIGAELISGLEFGDPPTP